MSQIPVGEPLEIRLDEPDGSLEALEIANDTSQLTSVAARWPECLTAWAALGEASLDSRHTVQAYAYFRVGYHRGLDRLRKAGWRGSGHVPWVHVDNQGFLRSLKGLGLAAEEIGELDEAQRCFEFYAQLAPEAP